MLQQSGIEWKDLTLRLCLDFLKKMHSFYKGTDLTKEIFSATSNTSIQCQMVYYTDYGLSLNPTCSYTLFLERQT